MPSCSAPERPWSTRPCSRRSATSPTRSWRARSVGVYRLWRDGGFAVGALLAGILADLVSIDAAIWAVAALTAASGIVVIVRMYETHPPGGQPGRQTEPSSGSGQVSLVLKGPVDAS